MRTVFKDQSIRRRVPPAAAALGPRWLQQMLPVCGVLHGARPSLSVRLCLKS